MMRVRLLLCVCVCSDGPWHCPCCTAVVTALRCPCVLMLAADGGCVSWSRASWCLRGLHYGQMGLMQASPGASTPHFVFVVANKKVRSHFGLDVISSWWKTNTRFFQFLLRKIRARYPFSFSQVPFLGLPLNRGICQS